MRAGTRQARTFWWDRARPTDADICQLRAVIFDVDALADFDRDGDLGPVDADEGMLDRDVEPRSGLIDLVMSLFVAGVWVAVVSTGRRACVETLVRELVGDGLVETIVTGDDMAAGKPRSELYRLALWELGIARENALAITGSVPGMRAAAAAGLATLVASGVFDCEVRSSYDSGDPLLADGCQRVHRRWWVTKKRAA
jgi:beta-phosphoglucomutase-like phosphatase (HAD superfamily)